jgi:hypothetical protein
VSELQGELDRVTRTVLDEAGAANVWAGTTGLDLVAALNRRAGTTQLDLPAVLNKLANQTGLDQMGAAALLRGVSSLRFPGTSGNYASTPDSVLNSVTGDIDIRVYVSLDNWKPAVINTILAKRDLGGTNPAYRISVTPSTGFFDFTFWPGDGSAFVGKQTTIAPSFVNGQAGWIRVTLDVDNGAGGNTAQFYTSTDGITWTAFDVAKVNTGVVSILDTSAPLILGGTTGQEVQGNLYYAEVRNGIEGPVVAQFDSSQVQVLGNQSPATINGWTVNGSQPYRRDDYMRFPGVSSNYATYPDTSATSVIGDIDVRAKVSLDDWTPAAYQTVVSKFLTGQRSYTMRVSPSTSGRLEFTWSADGNTATAVSSSANIPFADGTVGWIRATLAVATGQVMFYTATDGATWTQLGTTPAAQGATSIYDSTSPTQIGGDPNNPLAGNVYYAEVRNGINGPVVTSFDARNISTPWTMNGTGWSWQGASFTGKPGIAWYRLAGTGSYVSTPDSAANSVTGDIDLRVKASADNWNTGSLQYFIYKRDTNIGYGFRIATSGQLEYVWGDGTTNTFADTTTWVPPANGATLWLRVTHVVNNGASGNTRTWYTSTDGATWTQIFTATGAGVTSIADGPSVLAIGADNGGGSPLFGKIYYAEVRSGVDGPVVARFDATAVARLGTRSPTTTTQLGGNPNLLTPNQASIETDTTGWASVNQTPTLARDTTQFLDGAASLSLTATSAAASMSARNSPYSQVPVVPGKMYTAVAWTKTNGTPTANALVQIYWYGPTGTFLSSTSNSSIAATTTWQSITNTGVAPAGAAFGAVAVGTLTAPAIGDVYYYDRISLVEAAVTWTMNGTNWDFVNA